MPILVLSQFPDGTFAKWLRAAPVLSVASLVFLGLTWSALQPSGWLLVAFVMPIAELSAKFLLGFSRKRYRTVGFLIVVLLLHSALLTLVQRDASATIVVRLFANLQYMAAVLLGMGVGLLVFRGAISSGGHDA
jgi:Ni,Fe-hydrogenase I cytochrome b subunit